MAFIVWNGLEQSGPWLSRLLAGMEQMSWATVASTGTTTTLILIWERFAMVLARKMLNRNREIALAEGREEGLEKGRQEGRRETAQELKAWLEAREGGEEAARAIQGWLDRQKAALDAGQEFNEPMPLRNGTPQQ